MYKLILAGYLSIICLNITAQDELTVVYYNLLNYPGSTPERITYLRNIVQYTRPDLFVVNELQSDDAANDILNNALNQYGINDYQKAAFTDGPDSDNMLFYNSDRIKLLNQDTIKTALRYINKYGVYYNDPGLPEHKDTVFLEVFSLHLRPNPGDSAEQLRLDDCILLRDYIDTKTKGSNIIAGGDLNLYSSSEPAYSKLLNEGIYKLYDPVNTPGNWSGDSSFAGIHTQSTRLTSFGGGASGGLDDRFDFILVSGDIMDGANDIEYISGSYKAFGNDGMHFGDSLTALALNPNIPDSVTYSLYNMSDHLPVMLKLAVNTKPIANPAVYPNPNDGEFTVKFLLDTLQKVNLRLNDLAGRSVFAEEITGNSGVNEVLIGMQHLSQGVYLFQIRGTIMIYNQKIVVFK